MADDLRWPRCVAACIASKPPSPVLIATPRIVTTTIVRRPLVQRSQRVVDYHCSVCHHNGFSDITPDFRAVEWTGPRRCSCGVTSDYGV